MHVYNTLCVSAVKATGWHSSYSKVLNISLVLVNILTNNGDNSSNNYSNTSFTCIDIR